MDALLLTTMAIIAVYLHVHSFIRSATPWLY